MMTNSVFISGLVSGIICGTGIAFLFLRKPSRRTLIAKKPTDDEPIASIEGEQALVKEQLSRIACFYGDENFAKIRQAFVIIVGAGGVGSHAAIHLLRSGVANIRIIDFDMVTLSSLNRHACAVRSDVGRPKVEVIRSFSKLLFPYAIIDSKNCLFDLSSADVLLSGNPDIVLDCIDNVETKVDLLRYCHSNNVQVISSMGSACKSDPTQLNICDISETSDDKLARVVRQKLRKLGVHDGIPVVISKEKARVELQQLEISEGENPQEYSALPKFRARILPVLGPLPAIFGASMAAWALCHLADFQDLKQLSSKKRKSFEKILSEFRSSLSSPSDCLISVEDVAFILDDLWKGKSCTGNDSEKLSLVKWIKSEKADIRNVVPMTKQEAKKHLTLSDDLLQEHYSYDFISFMNSKLSS